MSDPYSYLPLRDHLKELRGRFVWSLATLLFFSFLAYCFRVPLSTLVLLPIDQPLYYTAPAGGFNFLLKLCLAAGFICTIPVVTYHCLRFFEPILPKSLKRVFVYYLLSSFLLLSIGLLFAYLVIIPTALRFLQTFDSQGVQSLISVTEYLSFILLYLTGFALIFQLPLVLLLVNRYHTLSTRLMLSKLPIILLVSFIIAAIVTPTPDPINQTLMAAPIIALYGLSIIVIWLVNRFARLRPAVD